MGSAKLSAAAGTTSPPDYDVIIIGAGLSGINAGYRVQSELPNYKYTILENRGAIGGTWDLFRYPGIRSDSDLHTFGFPWNPWTHNNAIADGALIKSYIEDCAHKFGIDRKIQFHHKLVAADWSSDHQQWSLSIQADGKEKTLTARFIILGTGYYDYNEPLEANIPGISNFKGKVIHPQFWPEDLDYDNKKIIVIGSGATAITLIPNLAKDAAKVTMLQRSPSYVMGFPRADTGDSWVRKWMPPWFANNYLRWKFIIMPLLFFKFCRAFPKQARKIIRGNTESQLPKTVPHDPAFNPTYNPWEQRLCICPDGDFFKSLGTGKADVVTDTIKTVTDSGIVTASGKNLEADIIVTATGLKIQMAGGAKISVDGNAISINSKFFWRSVMLQDIPNASVVMGYTNASWTLGSDTTANLLCRLFKYMDKNNLSSVTPRVAAGSKMADSAFLDFNSTYIEKAKGTLPRAGDRGPWLARSDYFTDTWTASYGSLRNLITDLHFTKMFEVK